MSEEPKIVLPHGGYRKLAVYDKSDTLYRATQVFCRRFLPAHGDRTVDQMTQAARSCKQNIAEGSAASGTSKETEIRLTNVARATLDELEEDFLDRLKADGQLPWPMEDARAVAAKRCGREHADWAYWRPIFETRPRDVFCNLMITLINQTKKMLDGMIARQEEDFRKFGGVRERMHAARTAVRGDDWAKGVYCRLDAAETADELNARAEEIRRKVASDVWSIKRKKGWT